MILADKQHDNVCMLMCFEVQSVLTINVLDKYMGNFFCLWSELNKLIIVIITTASYSFSLKYVSCKLEIVYQR